MIKVFIDGNEIKQSEKNGGVCGEHNSTEMLLSFGEDWAGYNKKVVFYNTLGFNPVTVLLTDGVATSSTAEAVPLPLEGKACDREEYLIRIPGEALEFEGKAEYVVVGTVVEEQSIEGETKQIVAARKKSVDGVIRVRYSPSGESEAIPEEVAAALTEQLQAQAERIQSKVDEVTEIAVSSAPYIDPDTETWFVYDAETKTHIDSNISAKGEKGDTGEKGEKGDTGPQGEKGDDAEIFTVNFTRIGYDKFKSDKTFDEICEALDAGKTVVGNQSGYVSQLMMRIDNLELFFLETQYGGQHVIYDMIPGFYDDAGNQLLYATTYDYVAKPYFDEQVSILETNIMTKIDESAEETKPFIVTITDLESGDFAASDKKVGEIYAAYQEGKEIIGVHGAYILRFISAIETECLFAEVTLDGKHIVYDVFDNGDNEGNVAVSTFDYTTKTYVEDAIADLKKASVFRVSCYTNGYYHGCNKSNSEIVDAFHNGRNIVATFSLSGGSEMAQMCEMVSFQTQEKIVQVGDIGTCVEYVIFKFFDGTSIFTVEFDPQTEQWCVNGEQPMVQTPVKGVDYWTEEDKAEIKTYVEDAILGGAW